MSRRDEQLARMKGLMTYGTSSTTKKTPVTESIEGPDGKIYAIIREGAKYHIKTTSKGKELVTESFDYIGGFMNKKNNEYSSYNQASKNLELKMRSLNEAYGVNKPVELLNPEKKESLMVEMTDAMKSSIARYRQIMNNAAGIMNESNTISASNTGNPEAPKTTGFNPNLGEPFTNKAEATLDKDLKQTAKEPENQGEPFGDNSKAEEYKDAQYVPDGSVANKKPTGGKVARVNENVDSEEPENDSDDLVIDECDEWGSCGLPSTPGVGEIGDDAPFTLKEDENDVENFDAEEDVENEDDIDLDDIDTDLDDIEGDEELDDEIDDIDSDEELDDESEKSEIESLRDEIEELRDMISQLLNQNDEEEPEFDDEEDEFELEFDDEEEPEFDDEEDEYELEFDDEEEGENDDFEFDEE
jgi:hypothetical protein